MDMALYPAEIPSPGSIPKSQEFPEPELVTLDSLCFPGVCEINEWDISTLILFTAGKNKNVIVGVTEVYW